MQNSSIDVFCQYCIVMCFVLHAAHSILVCMGLCGILIQLLSNYFSFTSDCFVLYVFFNYFSVDLTSQHFTLSFKTHFNSVFTTETITVGRQT